MAERRSTTGGIEDWLANIDPAAVPTSPSISIPPLRRSAKTHGPRDRRGLDYITEADNTTGLAKKFDLHAPFRQMDTLLPHEDHNTTQRQFQNKRKRSSSATPYLEPMHDPITRVGHIDRAETRTRSRRVAARKGPMHNISQSSSSTSTSNNVSEHGLETLEKTYRRRPRHKTRKDLYEYKPTKEKKEKRKKESARRGKKQKKHQRHEKSGNALLHSFTASNVHANRLTVSQVNKIQSFVTSKICLAEAGRESWSVLEGSCLFTNSTTRL